MRRVVIVIPEWVREDDGDDLLRQELPSLTRIAEAGEVFKISRLPETECPEAFVLGVGPGVAELRQGPLTISALGADPPERSVHFHLSLLEAKDGLVQESDLVPPSEDLAKVLEVVPKLNSRVLTFVKGENRDHGLVWEGLGHLLTIDPSKASGKPLKEVFPEGDGEVMLRRYIDDSINLLSELELNERRADQGLPRLNLLWPWGNGVRIPLPNLALKRGSIATVVSESLRMQGLTRLVGYRHVDRRNIGNGLKFRLAEAAQMALRGDPTIIYLSAIADLEGEKYVEERAWFTRQVDQLLLAPILNASLREPISINLYSPSERSIGLGVCFRPNSTQTGSIPYDRRALDESKLRIQSLWEPISRDLAPSSPSA